MFEVGFSEIVLILGLALLVLGPEKLPGLAEKVGRWTGRARAMARQLRTQLEQEVTIEEMAKSRPMQSPKSEPEPTAAAATPETHSTAHTEPVREPLHENVDLDAPTSHNASGHDTSVPASMPDEPIAASVGEKVPAKIT